MFNDLKKYIFLGYDCQTENGQTCIFPFNYKGTTYHQCPSVDNNVPWCAYEVDSAGTLVEGEWGNCTATCFCSHGWQGKNCDKESKLDNEWSTPFFYW